MFTTFSFQNLYFIPSFSCLGRNFAIQTNNGGVFEELHLYSKATQEVSEPAGGDSKCAYFYLEELASFPYQEVAGYIVLAFHKFKEDGLDPKSISPQNQDFLNHKVMQILSMHEFYGKNLCANLGIAFLKFYENGIEGKFTRRPPRTYCDDKKRQKEVLEKMIQKASSNTEVNKDENIDCLYTKEEFLESIQNKARRVFETRQKIKLRADLEVGDYVELVIAAVKRDLKHKETYAKGVECYNNFLQCPSASLTLIRGKMLGGFNYYEATVSCNGIINVGSSMSRIKAVANAINGHPKHITSCTVSSSRSEESGGIENTQSTVEDHFRVTQTDQEDSHRK